MGVPLVRIFKAILSNFIQAWLTERVTMKIEKPGAVPHPIVRKGNRTRRFIKWLNQHLFSIIVTILSTAATTWLIFFGDIAHTASIATSTEYAEARRGTSGGKCSGELTVAQEIQCMRYMQVLSSWTAMRYVRNYIDLVPSCILMPCGNVASMLWHSWPVMMFTVIVIFIFAARFASWVMNFFNYVPTFIYNARERNMATYQRSGNARAETLLRPAITSGPYIEEYEPISPQMATVDS
jgi:amino acid transporter